MTSTQLWTESRVETLTTLWADGLTITAIAARLGVSRGAVSGKIDRLGLVGRSGGAAGQEISRARRRRGTSNGEKPFSSGASPCRRKAPGQSPSVNPATEAPAHLPTEATDLTPAAGDPPYADCVALIDLKEHHCRYPIGDPVKFCGREKAHGSYCTEHHLRCIARTNPNRKWAPDDPRRQRFAARERLKFASAI